MNYLCTKDDLIALSEHATAKGYNQQLISEKLKELEAEKFLLAPVLLHEHIAGLSQPPENWQQRLMVYIDATKQFIGLLDVNISVWNECVKDSVPVETGS